jgi:hypothetical protein
VTTECWSEMAEGWGQAGSLDLYRAKRTERPAQNSTPSKAGWLLSPVRGYPETCWQALGVQGLGAQSGAHRAQWSLVMKSPNSFKPPRLHPCTCTYV